MLACAALTSDDLPMPRAPHSRALLAGSPSAKRSVFSIRMSRIRSIPLSRPRSTRLTRRTGASRPFGCQTKASALSNESLALTVGDAAARRVAMVSRARAILSVVSCSAGGAGRFVAVACDFRAGTLEAARDTVLRGFFDILEVPDGAPISGLTRRCNPSKSEVWQRCNWDRGRYSPREFARTGLDAKAWPFHSHFTRIVQMLSTPALPHPAPAAPTNSTFLPFLP